MFTCYNIYDTGVENLVGGRQAFFAKDQVNNTEWCQVLITVVDDQYMCSI